jgi:AraC family transcriptional regulator
MTPHARRTLEPGITSRRTITGFSLKAFSQPPDCRLPRHEHEHASVCFVVSGFYAERARGREHECAPHSMVFKPAAEPHADVFGRAGGRCLLIEILPGRLESIEQCSNVTAAPRLARSPRLAALGDRLHREFHEADAASPLALEGLILEIMADASRAVANESGPAEPRWLRQAREFLHDRLDEPLTLSGVASAVGIHPAHLARTFRKRHGCTVGEYVRRLRIERASRDLVTSGAPLSEIGLRSGFFDQSHFSKVFRRHTGMTPAEYRANVANVRATSA